MANKFLEFQKSRFGGPAMTKEEKPDARSAATAPNSIWAYIITRLSDRTGLSIYWLHFIMLLAGSLIAFSASEGLRKIGCDSAVLLFRVATVLSAVGALVVLLPSVGRRIVVSLFILFHFVGILTAVTSVSPSPWLSTQIWTTVYRPYLYFLWLNNAYHFYSPQPGPANLLWFCIEYESDSDGTRNFRWVLIPDWDDDGHPVNPDGSRVFSGTEYTRRLSLAEYTGSGGGVPWDLYQLIGKRMEKGQLDRIPLFDPRILPYDQQYKLPDDRSKRWIQTYVRHVAATFKHQNPAKEHLPVKTVKFYRVLHQILDPGQIIQGMEPNDTRLYYPFYCGEFDKDGNYSDRCVRTGINSEGYFQWEVRDPYLYWIIPTEYLIRHAQGAGPEKVDSNMRQMPDNAQEGNESEVKR
jgi:hypothetical protein